MNATTIWIQRLSCTIAAVGIVGIVDVAECCLIAVAGLNVQSGPVEPGTHAEAARDVVLHLEIVCVRQLPKQVMAGYGSLMMRRRANLTRGSGYFPGKTPPAS